MPKQLNYWIEIQEFAKEQGFKTKNFEIFLPLGKVANIEYGVCLSCYIFLERGPLAYVLEGDDLKALRPPTNCFMPEMIIKTAEIGDNKYVVEKKMKLSQDLDRARALILAFKFKELGTLDSSFLDDIYMHILEVLPKDIGKELIMSKVSELEEKLDEVNALASNLPEDEIDKIKTNIYSEMRIYVKAAYHQKIILPFDKSSRLAGVAYHVMQSERSDNGN